MADNVKGLKAELNKTHELSTRVARSTIAVIDTVVQRGGFKGEELSTIGQLRDQAVQAIQFAEAYAAENSVKTPEK